LLIWHEPNGEETVPSSVLLSGWLRLQFAPVSTKIRAIAFTFTACESDDSQGDSLNAQVSYPSVVSLEADSKDRREATLSFDKKLDMDGPGMTI
jgi:hypothetical protein